jgi:hypothetical protein
MMPAEPGMPPSAEPVQPVSKRGRGRPPTHGLHSLKKAVAQLTTKRLDGRSALVVAVRRWKDDVRRTRRS